MIKRRLLSLGLAAMMVVSSSVVALAAEASTESVSEKDGVYSSSEITVTGDITTPTISVTVPTSGGIMVNPYNISVAANDNLGLAASSASLISANYTIKSTSNVPLSVDVTVTGKTDGGVTFATASAAKSTAKSVFTYLEVTTETDGSNNPKYADAYSSKATNQVVVSTKATTKKGVVTLGVGSESATNAYYTFKGDAATTPTKAWDSTDKISATVVFTFTPQVVPES